MLDTLGSAAIKEKVELDFAARKRKIITIYVTGNLILAILLILIKEAIYLIFTISATTSVLFIKFKQLQMDKKYTLMLEAAKLEAAQTEESFGRFFDGVFEPNTEGREQNPEGSGSTRPTGAFQRHPFRRPRIRRGYFLDHEIGLDRRIDTELQGFNDGNLAEEGPEFTLDENNPQNDRNAGQINRNGSNADQHLPRMDIFDPELPFGDVELIIRNHIERRLAVRSQLKQNPTQTLNLILRSSDFWDRISAFHINHEGPVRQPQSSRVDCSEIPSVVYSTIHPDIRTMTECAICLRNYQESDLLRALECSHYFHQECLDPWIKMKNSCPMCKHRVL